ncbi:MAG TPA: rhomboid family intramembrane serine protease [Candidatus Limnocylindrales bacterium]|nr:rhomboid family intramembrane serine protease [Candidatus Limnocylindrales bacterium]
MFPLHDTIKYHGATVATIGLIILSGLVYFYQISLGVDAFEHIFYNFGFIPVNFFSNPVGEFSTIFTSMFIHGSFVHLLGNVWFLWVFAPAVEGRLGFRRFMLLYLLSGIAAALLQGFSYPDAIIPMVGASGAVSGVLGAYLLLFPRARVLTFIPPFFFFIFWLPAPIYLGYWVVLQFIYAMIEVQGVAWWAHIGGFLLGMVLVLIVRPKRIYKADPFWECWRDYC